MTICTRPSCGADHPPTSDAFLTSDCTHHPGEPVFHEGQKSWSCCKEVNKPVLDFDDFVKIAGCTTVKGHSSVRKVKKEETQPNGAGANGVGQPTVDENGKEVYGNGAAAASSSKTSAASAPAPAPKAAPPKPAAPQPYVEPRDPEGVTIAPGSICKRPGCGAKYDESEASGSRDLSKEQCRYHKGAPMFHEGTKGYTCCKRRVLEFSEFMKIEPCTTSSNGHLFIQPPPQAPSTSDPASASASAASQDPLLASHNLTLQPGEAPTEVRMDHYETRDSVHLTFYCRGLDVDASRVILLPEDVLLSLSMGQGTKRCLLRLPLYASVEEEGGDGKSSWTVSPSKIKLDVVLQKKERGRSWPTLTRGGRGGGLGVTFGVN